MKLSHIALSVLLTASMTLTGCIDQTKDAPNQVYIYSDDNTTDPDPEPPLPTLPKETLAGDIAIDTTLTADKAWVIDGLVVVKSGVTLTIEEGTIILGKDGTGTNTSYMIVDKGAKIMAVGSETNPIIFTSEIAYDGGNSAEGQWGGLTIIGNACASVPLQCSPYEVNSAFEPGFDVFDDDSGVLSYVKILNSGITMEQDKEINGLSLVGVGSGTTIEHLTVEKSDDDCIEIWGGTVDLTDVTVRECTDDQFDIDDGYEGTVKDLDIYQTTGNAGIEMSGDTYATFDGFTITQETSAKEGGIYFKGAGIGGYFSNGIVRDNSIDTFGTINSLALNDVNTANTSFENVKLTGTSTDPRFTGGDAANLESVFNIGTANAANEVTLSGDILVDTTLAADTIWIIDGLVAVKGATLTIQAGTVIAGKDGTGANTSYMIVDKGAQIIADGDAINPITFTSTKAFVDGDADAVGQWGGLTIIGNACDSVLVQCSAYEVNSAFEPGFGVPDDDSGILRFVKILNSGITMEQDKEINGLSLVGVGSGTTIEDITVEKSDDDCIEAWGGTVNMTNITLRECTDDQFDIDEGYAGTVTNLDIHQTATNPGNAGIEMSGITAATFDGFSIIQDASAKEGGIFFKNAGIGGDFLNGTVTDNINNGAGAIHTTALNDTDTANTSFTNVELSGTSTDPRFTGDDAANVEAVFDLGTGNSK